jgi:hypothetical protein
MIGHRFDRSRPDKIRGQARGPLWAAPPFLPADFPENTALFYHIARRLVKTALPRRNRCVKV